jgi:hypothetical protein
MEESAARRDGGDWDGVRVDGGWVVAAAFVGDFARGDFGDDGGEDEVFWDLFAGPEGRWILLVS